MPAVFVVIVMTDLFLTEKLFYQRLIYVDFKGYELIILFSILQMPLLKSGSSVEATADGIK